MRIIEENIHIQASGTRVWEVLTEFARYSEWNPFILEVSGEALAGSRLKVRILPPGGKAMTFKPLVLTATPGVELRWTGHLGLPGFFDGDHRFRIEGAGDNQVLFSQSEQFRGVLVPLFPGKLFERVRRGFVEMNEALKHRVEKLSV